MLMPEVLIGKVRSGEIKKRMSLLLKEMKKSKVSYLFVLPFVSIFFVFVALPVIISIILGFTHFNLLEAPRWAGWANYKRMLLADDVFIIAIKNTFLFAAITGPLSYIACLMFAWFINELTSKIRAFMTLVFYAPSISGMLYFIWQIMFSGDSYGYVNGILLKLGIIQEPIQWFTDTRFMLPLVIVVILWLSLGTSFLAFIAGFQNVDRTLYEAGAVDGVKNRWQELWFITLPSMKPQLMFGAVMSITAAFGTGGVQQALTGMVSTDYAVHTVALHLADHGNVRFEMGYASAIATVLFFIMIGANKYIQKLLSKVGV
jgi:multiple sugar transport system permease protein